MSKVGQYFEKTSASNTGLSSETCLPINEEVNPLRSVSAVKCLNYPINNALNSTVKMWNNDYRAPWGKEIFLQNAKQNKKPFYKLAFCKRWFKILNSSPIALLLFTTPRILYVYKSCTDQELSSQLLISEADKFNVKYCNKELKSSNHWATFNGMCLR
jgi:hypothetical protein